MKLSARTFGSGRVEIEEAPFEADRGALSLPRLDDHRVPDHVEDRGEHELLEGRDGQEPCE